MISSQKQKKQPLLNFFIHLAHSNGHQNPRLRYHSTNEANRTFVAAKPTRLKNVKNGTKMKNVSLIDFALLDRKSL
jgi:hypothetical protein